MPISGHPRGHHDRLGDPPGDPTRALHLVASRNTYRNICPDSGRSRPAATSVSRSAQIRDTSDLEIPLLPTPSALTKSPALQVEVPCRWAQQKKWSTQTCYGVTSLTVTQASPTQLAAIIRGHWAIEDRLHSVRDVD